MPALNSLVDLLTLERIPGSASSFRAPAAGERHVRAFGGRTVAQAVMAAGSTVAPERHLHSLHAYFLRPGNSSEPMECRVETVRDGRSFSVRRVEAIQSGNVILAMMASFHGGENGPVHQDDMPTVSAPEDLPSFDERFAGREREDDMARWFFRANPFDVRYVNTSPFEGRHRGHPASQQLWFRAKQLPESPMLHAGAIAYATDMTILDAVLLRHQMQWTDRKILGATLDHAIWFHQPANFNQWLLFDQQSSIANNGRALATAKLWNQQGHLVATVTQEALMRSLDV